MKRKHQDMSAPESGLVSASEPTPEPESTPESKSDSSRIVLSAEQQAIVDCDGNVSVNARAGAGKTTVAIASARRTKKKTLILTYSKQLARETNDKIDNQFPTLRQRITVLTLHAFANAQTDEGLDPQIVKNWRWRPRSQGAGLSEYSLFVIDEAQDLSPLLVSMLKICLLGTIDKETSRLVVIGDYFQCIYSSLLGADASYLTCPEKWTERKFKSLNLSVSFRITHQIAAFINKELNPLRLAVHYPGFWRKHGDTVTRLWGNGISATKHGPKVETYACNTWYKQELRQHGVLAEIKEKLKTGRPEDVCLIVSTTDDSTATPSRVVVNALTDHNWCVILSGRGRAEMAVSDGQMRNKALACTTFAMKGSERKHVFVNGFDSYCEGHNPESPLHAFNLLYVGFTRAMESLSVLVHTDGKVGRFCTQRERGEYPQVVEKRPKKSMAVTDLVSYTRASTAIANNVVQTVCEHRTSDLRGVRRMEIDCLERDVTEDVCTATGVLVEKALCAKWMSEEFDWAGEYARYLEGHAYQNYRKQIRPEDFGWTQDAVLCELVENAHVLVERSIGPFTLVRHNGKVEKNEMRVENSPGYTVRVWGEYDFLVQGADGKLVLIELKVTGGVSDAQAHQVLCYAALCTEDIACCLVVNPLIGECREIRTKSDLAEHLGRLVAHKYAEDIGSDGSIDFL
jgi:hypothetical protein